MVLGCWGLGSDFYGKVDIDTVVNTVHTQRLTEASICLTQLELWETLKRFLVRP